MMVSGPPVITQARTSASACGVIKRNEHCGSVDAGSVGRVRLIRFLCATDKA